MQNRFHHEDPGWIGTALIVARGPEDGTTAGSGNEISCGEGIYPRSAAQQP
ncbi:hypothetical protein JFT81_09590 [Pseudomonas sp. TH43]|uniref:hypothetical protein n=1 Tax=Pseudomonas sp. TH43 TaxID=2796407 RepID=UPI0019137EEB|nr:hypothetical protein [Pseudomonas sp. TH43]MBK5374888.1 hypothetical protein [Pseudomonas sp. TH43]